MGHRADGTDLRRFETYTRASFLFVFLATHGAAALTLAPTWRTDALHVAALLGLGAHLVASIVHSTRALAEAPRSRRTETAYGVFTLVVTGLLAAVADPEAWRETGAGAYSPIALVLGAGLATLGLTLRWRHLVTAGAVAVAVLAAAFLARGVGVAAVLGLVVLAVLILVLLAPLGPLTWWMLDVVRTLARSRTTHARLAVAEERLRFSRDLHDVYGRTLSAIALKSELAAELARRGDERAVGEMTAVRDLAQSSLVDARRLVAGYRDIDPATELAGSRSVLRSAGARLTETGVDDALARLDDRGRTAAAWVLREASTNVLRHSAASSVHVSARIVGDRVELSIVNDGADPRGADRPGSGTGLLGLSERLREVGGALSTSSGEGRFTLVATLPLCSRVVPGPDADAPSDRQDAAEGAAAAHADAHDQGTLP
ncbi:sensor histidine kinase [Agilicoccus flavus]|uniref:sensor histidine kinase n=1 Tax=Agilicoccus flavus TaxID=2775968 RepID=UPI001CF6D4B6|nr:histidine kinase [Agilicoccus flavus]